MLKVSVFYPGGRDVRFDMSYYLDRHIPMVRQLLGSYLKGVSVEEGISGAQINTPPSYVAMGHLLFESLADFQSSFCVHAKPIVEDVPNYTNSKPIIQISEVKL